MGFPLSHSQHTGLPWVQKESSDKGLLWRLNPTSFLALESGLYRTLLQLLYGVPESSLRPSHFPDYVVSSTPSVVLPLCPFVHVPPWAWNVLFHPPLLLGKSCPSFRPMWNDMTLVELEGSVSAGQTLCLLSTHRGCELLSWFSSFWASVTVLPGLSYPCYWNKSSQKQELHDTPFCLPFSPEHCYKLCN